jgi:hypothetical protein
VSQTNLDDVAVPLTDADMGSASTLEGQVISMYIYIISPTFPFPSFSIPRVASALPNVTT